MKQQTFMQRAIDLALQKMRENSGAGGDRIIAEGWNQVTSVPPVPMR
jgi:hypothetical protein